MLGVSRPDGFARHQEGVERAQVADGRLGEMIVGKGRIEVGAVAPHALAHGPQEGRLRPSPNARIGIGCNVAGIDRAEWRLERATPRIGRPILFGVADVAIADQGKLGPFGDKGSIEAGSRRRLNGR